MAASNFESTGRTNYYSVSYGKLSKKERDAPEGAEEIKETTLKQATQNVENIDLRNRYVLKTGDYPYVVFYDTIEGNITDFKKDEYDKGISLRITIIDLDGDESIIQSKFYSKYSEDVLNRLLSVGNIGSNIRFTPYAIPNTSEIEGKNISYYNSGISIKENGTKLERSHTAESKTLPPTERVQNAEGKMQTSRVNRINFLFEEFSKKFANIADVPKAEPTPKKTTAKTVPTATPQEAFEPATAVNINDHDDLPF